MTTQKSGVTTWITPLKRVPLSFISFRKIYFTSSKTTLTDYQCVSTGCCIHVAKTETTIDNQHVTKSLQRYIILPKQPKENTEKITNLLHF